MLNLCELALQPAVLSELQNIRRDIYLAPTRIDRLILNASFEKKLNELAELLKISPIELLNKLELLPIQELKKSIRISNDKSLELLKLNKNYGTLRAEAIELLNQLHSEKISMQVHWNRISTLINLDLIYQWLILIIEKESLLTEYQKTHPNFNIAEVSDLITIPDFNEIYLHNVVLFDAIESNDISLVQLLVWHGADINKKITASSFRNALEIYINKEIHSSPIQYEMVKTLILLGSEIRIEHEYTKRLFYVNCLHTLAKKTHSDFSKNFEFEWQRIANLLILHEPLLLTLEEQSPSYTPLYTALETNQPDWMLEWFFTHMTPSNLTIFENYLKKCNSSYYIPFIKFKQNRLNTRRS